MIYTRVFQYQDMLLHVNTYLLITYVVSVYISQNVSRYNHNIHSHISIPGYASTSQYIFSHYIFSYYVFSQSI